MKLAQLEYVLPKKLIADTPMEPRDHAKLMIISRSENKITNKHFYDLLGMLTPNDVLVFNQTKVFPARMLGKKDSGGKIELLLLQKTQKIKNIWQAIYKGKVNLGQILIFETISGKVTGIHNNVIEILFYCQEDELSNYLDKYGLTPLPPYIQSKEVEKEIRSKYQTVYAKETGSVAAPTAGFHFTTDLLNKITSKGIQIEYVTLHVGLGTFLPIKEDDITKHKIHTERFNIDKKVIDRLNTAKQNNKRIIAVGTTTVRVLESIANEDNKLQKIYSGETSIYIYPPYKYRFVDSLITNFHLPHSTLLALVSAFVSYPNTLEKFVDFKSSLIGKAYKEAIKENYRFYSFGDASLIY